MPTKRTAEEAKAYIIESIELWEKEGIEKRIISLSNWAELWRSRSEIAATTNKIKMLKISIKDLQRAIARNIKMGYETKGLYEQWETMSNNCSELEASYTPPVRKTRNQKK